MKRKIKQALKRFLARWGLRVGFVSKGELSPETKVLWLKRLGIRTIIDVGASKGNFSFEFHGLFPDAHIFAFEPLHDCFQLTINKMQGIPNFTAYNIALSDSRGEQEIYRSSYSGASSLIPMAPLQKELFPVTAGQTREKIKTDTLDAVLGSVKLEEPMLIKLDVQGTEDVVIRGGRSLFRRAKIVITETSFQKLYEHQPLFNDICKQLEELEYRYVGIWGEGDFRSPIDGRPLQQDSIFLREDA